MIKKLLGVAIVLLALLALSACAIRNTGPCLGYGCPAISGTGQYTAGNTNSQAKSATVAAKKAPAAQPVTNSGK